MKSAQAAPLTSPALGRDRLSINLNVTVGDFRDVAYADAVPATLIDPRAYPEGT